MRTESFEGFKEVVQKNSIAIASMKALDVGGATSVVLDLKWHPNPLVSLFQSLEFLDYDPRLRPTHMLNFLTDNIGTLVGRYDMAVSFDTLEHVEDPWVWCQRMVSIVKPGGYVYLSTVFLYTYHPSPRDFFRFTPDGLRLLFQRAGAEILEYGWEETGNSWQEKQVGVYILARRKS